MDIALVVPGMPFNGNTIPEGKSLGGSESAGYYMAKALVKRGHRVYVFTNSQENGKIDGVIYEFLGQPTQEAPLGINFHNWAQCPVDVVIAQRHPLAFNQYLNSKLNVWWLHDLALYRNAGQAQAHLINTDQIFTVSEWHKNQVAEVYNLPSDFITATTNGLNYAEYDGLSKPYDKREPKSMIFASRPERGLENLVKPGGIMERMPDCKLYVCCYNNTTPDMAPYYQQLWERCNALPNVINVGHLGKKQLAELMANVMLYAYPTNFEDTSCMISLEANACGTPFLGFKTGALPETMKDAGAVLLDLDNKDEIRPDKWIRDAYKYMEKDAWTGLHEKALAKNQNWDAAAEQWEKRFIDLIGAKCKDSRKLYKHFEQMSDIVAMEHHAAANGNDLPDHVKKLYSFYFNDDFDAHYKAYYEYEKNRGVDYGPEDLHGQPRFHAVLNMIQAHNPKSILDYGCAHGHYVMNLAPHFKDTSFTGVDLVQTNIDKANAWARKMNLPNNINFICADYKSLKTDKKYDFIIMGEVIEHMARPQEAIQSMAQYLNPDGEICITVPYGPWEAIGYKQHPEWRAHLHHFEKQDLYDMFEAQDDLSVIAIPHTQMPGFGHFMATFKPNGKDIGNIDYERKCRMQSPKQSLSVCMIAKDEALNIAKCLSKVADIADEIIIGIDETTTDNTKEIAEAFGAKCFNIPNPIKDQFGFAACRNLTIDRATMDWILWIDADETLERAENIIKYLRQNAFNGYALKQHHISAEPPGVHKLDYPARLFRNGLGIEFQGVVHEHPVLPEKPEQGVGRAILLPDVDIMHQGYTTERIRQERFARNFPLMQKEMKINRERPLTRFLWIRDMVHTAHFGAISNGGRIGQRELSACNEAILCWRDLLNTKDLRLITESLQWYSDAARIVAGERGIETKIYLDIASGLHMGTPHAIIGKPIDPNNVVNAYFVNREDMDAYMKILTDAKTENINSKYY